MPPQPTETFPRVRPQPDEATRLDVHRLDVADPTVQVSPIGAHTRGSAATIGPDDARRKAAAVNALLDDRDRLAADRVRIAADTRRAWRGRPAVRSVREQAAHRAAQKLRHEQHLEALETVRAWIWTLTALGLLVIVIGAAVVGWSILAGWYVWQPVPTP